MVPLQFISLIFIHYGIYLRIKIDRTEMLHEYYVFFSLIPTKKDQYQMIKTNYDNTNIIYYSNFSFNTTFMVENIYYK